MTDAQICDAAAVHLCARTSHDSGHSDDEWEATSDDDDYQDDDNTYGSMSRLHTIMAALNTGVHCTAPLGWWRIRQAEREREAADSTEISQLESRELTKEELTKEEENGDKGVCAVCQCEWEATDEVRVLPCGHHFHTCCVDTWLTKHRACCPLCKCDVRTSWDDVSEEKWDPVTSCWVAEEEEEETESPRLRFRRPRRVGARPVQGVQGVRLRICSSRRGL